MFGFLNRWLGRFRRKPKTPKMILRCVVPDSVTGTRSVELFAKGTRGIMLMGVPVGEEGVRLVSEYQAVDQDHFWALWRHFNVGASFVWADDE